LHGRPDFRREHRDHARKPAVEHADDGERLAADPQRAVDDARIRPELPTPVTVRHDNCSRRAGTIVGWPECAADLCPDAEQIEVVARDHLTQREPWPPAARNRGEHRRVAGDVCEAGGLRPDVLQIGHGARRVEVAVGTARVDVHETGGLDDGQRPEEQGVGHGEDCRVEPDADAEGEDGDGGESRTPDEPPECVSRVLQECVNWCHRSNPCALRGCQPL
jgi:hypothetical protein